MTGTRLGLNPHHYACEWKDPDAHSDECEKGVLMRARQKSESIHKQCQEPGNQMTGGTNTRQESSQREHETESIPRSQINI